MSSNLSRAIALAATSIDGYGTPQARRFNARERRELLEAVAKAGAWEREQARRSVEAEPSPDDLYSLDSPPLWEPADTGFRAELLAQLRGERPPPPVPLFVTQRLGATSGDGSVGLPLAAVVLIDADHTSPLHDDVKTEQAAMREVLEQANRSGAPVFEVVYRITDERVDFETSPELAELRRPNWVRLEKTSDGAFETTNLADELEARFGARVASQETPAHGAASAASGVPLVVLGLNEDYCVLETVKQAVDAGLRPQTAPSLVQTAVAAMGTPRWKVLLYGWLDRPIERPLWAYLREHGDVAAQPDQLSGVQALEPTASKHQSKGGVGAPSRGSP